MEVSERQVLVLICIYLFVSKGSCLLLLRLFSSSSLFVCNPVATTKSGFTTKDRHKQITNNSFSILADTYHDQNLSCMFTIVFILFRKTAYFFFHSNPLVFGGWFRFFWSSFQYSLFIVTNFLSGDGNDFSQLLKSDISGCIKKQ